MITLHRLHHQRILIGHFAVPNKEKRIKLGGGCLQALLLTVIKKMKLAILKDLAKIYKKGLFVNRKVNVD
jgi:hypothetical protein